MKAAVGAGALAALGLIAVNYQSGEGSQLFLSERLSLEEEAYMRYVSEWGKSYGTKAEFKFRLEQFKKTMAKMANHNENKAHGSEVGLNHFSDWTEAEFKKLLGYKPEMKTQSNVKMLDTTGVKDATIDWREEGAVSPVKNQGQCGSCWAFSTSGAIEGSYFVNGKYLEYFSEQNLVDCVDKCKGCEGGLMDYGFEYAMQNPLMLESAYPYTAKDGECAYDRSKGYGDVKSFHDVTSGDADQLRAALRIGPVSVAIEADDFVFQGYTKGVITSDCGDKLDHGVLAVGFGTTDDGQDYFIVKNSWGPSWGDQGFVKIAPDQCGVTMNPSYPIS